MPNAGSSGAQGVTPENPDEHADQTKEHEKTAKACRTQMTSVPRPDGVPDGSPFGNLEDNHSVDGFSDEDAESVQDGVLDGSSFGNLNDDHSVDGFSDEDAESVQEGVPDGSPFGP